LKSIISLSLFYAVVLDVRSQDIAELTAQYRTGWSPLRDDKSLSTLRNHAGEIAALGAANLQEHADCALDLSIHRAVFELRWNAQEGATMERPCAKVVKQFAGLERIDEAKPFDIEFSLEMGRQRRHEAASVLAVE
jgi:hypothetical protein